LRCLKKRGIFFFNLILFMVLTKIGLVDKRAVLEEQVDDV